MDAANAAWINWFYVYRGSASLIQGVRRAMTSPWVRLGEPLSWIAVLLAATVVVLFVLMGTDVVPGSEPVAFVSFLAGLLAPVFAIVAYGLIKLFGNRVSRVTVMALVLGVIVALWPVLFFSFFQLSEQRMLTQHENMSMTSCQSPNKTHAANARYG